MTRIHKGEEYRPRRTARPARSDDEVRDDETSDVDEDRLEEAEEDAVSVDVDELVGSSEHSVVSAGAGEGAVHQVAVDQGGAASADDYAIEPDELGSWVLEEATESTGRSEEAATRAPELDPEADLADLARAADEDAGAHAGPVDRETRLKSRKQY